MQNEGMNLKEIGLGAALMITLMIIKEVVSTLLKKPPPEKKNSNGAGDKSTEYWELFYSKMEDHIVDRLEKIQDARNRTVDKVYESFSEALKTLLRQRGGSGD